VPPAHWQKRKSPEGVSRLVEGREDFPRDLGIGGLDEVVPIETPEVLRER